MTSLHVATFWDSPDFTLAMFGLQIARGSIRAAYFEAGIEEQVMASLKQEPGVLCVRDFPEGNGDIQLQYWRSTRNSSITQSAYPTWRGGNG